MNEKQLRALATELAKNLKTPEDLNQLSLFLKKLTVETALNAELTECLGHKKTSLKPFLTVEMVIRIKPSLLMKECLKSDPVLSQ